MAMEMNSFNIFHVTIFSFGIVFTVTGLLLNGFVGFALVLSRKFRSSYAAFTLVASHKLFIDVFLVSIHLPVISIVNIQLLAHHQISPLLCPIVLGIWHILSVLSICFALTILLEMMTRRHVKSPARRRVITVVNTILAWLYGLGLSIPGLVLFRDHVVFDNELSACVIRTPSPMLLPLFLPEMWYRIMFYLLSFGLPVLFGFAVAIVSAVRLYRERQPSTEIEEIETVPSESRRRMDLSSVVAYFVQFALIMPFSAMNMVVLFYGEDRKTVSVAFKAATVIYWMSLSTFPLCLLAGSGEARTALIQLFAGQRRSEGASDPDNKKHPVNPSVSDSVIDIEDVTPMKIELAEEPENNGKATTEEEQLDGNKVDGKTPENSATATKSRWRGVFRRLIAKNKQKNPNMAKNDEARNGKQTPSSKGSSKRDAMIDSGVQTPSSLDYSSDEDEGQEIVDSNNEQQRKGQAPQPPLEAEPDGTHSEPTTRQSTEQRANATEEKPSTAYELDENSVHGTEDAIDEIPASLTDTETGDSFVPPPPEEEPTSEDEEVANMLQDANASQSNKPSEPNFEEINNLPPPSTFVASEGSATNSLE